MKPNVLRTKPVSRLLAETEREGRKLRKALNAWDLTAIGIGCIPGVGIFVLPGVEAAKHACPFAFPWRGVFPAIDILLCGYLMLSLPPATRIRFIGWMLTGVFFYAIYGAGHSNLALQGAELSFLLSETPCRRRARSARIDCLLQHILTIVILLSILRP